MVVNVRNKINKILKTAGGHDSKTSTINVEMKFPVGTILTLWERFDLVLSLKCLF